ncbi:baseplate J/gp47 family protein [Tissierella pigra]|uniref:baseplate J/gp47 family protein n=1 Tax=Tissierella pigra TaxID=2607614 RepID=UPI001C0F7A67|nr:baseplate J/gp47 family protein [Tissierella pigra]MBU5427150.1 baseplate J/gp47 family protein [Tissierella pigra]
MENREEILKRILSHIPDKYDKSEGLFPYDFSKATAIEFENKNRGIQEVANKLDIENLSREELERFIHQRTGITRKLATKAKTMVTISGQEGARISKDDFVGSDTVNFISTEDKTIDDMGQMTVLVECEVPGTIGNVPARAIKYFPISIAGLTNVTNLESVKNGYDAESDFDLRQRYYERIRIPATSGNKYHYLNWAKEVVGVGDARVIPLWNGDNTVKVIVIDSNKKPASEDLISRVQEYIDPKGEYINNRWATWGTGAGQAPIGAFCTAISAASKDINISATITKDESYLLEQIKSNIEENITNYLKEIAFKKNLVSYAQIGSLILNVDGVLDYMDLRVNEGLENIIINNEEVAILGEVMLNE